MRGSDYRLNFCLDEAWILAVVRASYLKRTDAKHAVLSKLIITNLVKIPEIDPLQGLHGQKKMLIPDSMKKHHVLLSFLGCYAFPVKRWNAHNKQKHLKCDTLKFKDAIKSYLPAACHMQFRRGLVKGNSTRARMEESINTWWCWQHVD